VKPTAPPPQAASQPKPVSKKAKAKDKKEDEKSDLDKALAELSIKCVVSVSVSPPIVSYNSPGIRTFDRLRRILLPTHGQQNFPPFSLSLFLTLMRSPSSRSSSAPKLSPLPRLPRLPLHRNGVVECNYRHSVLNSHARNRPGV
jgi:hypothetical protein